MDYFITRNGELYAEEVPVTAIAEAIGTPFYCYSSATIERHYRVFRDSFGNAPVAVCYAVKANANLSVIRTLAKLGSGADVVSQGEIMLALQAGIPAEKIVFSGIGKTREEMAYALKENIGQFNIESEPELKMLSETAVSLNTTARIAIRVNPDVDGGTHHKIATGRKHDKFGIAWDEASALYRKASQLPGISVQAVATHIGSQITSPEPFRAAFQRIRELAENLRREGHAIRRVDFGGGLGIPYQEEVSFTPQRYAEMTLEVMKGFDAELLFEPGRLIVGNAGILVARVIYVKEAGKKFVILDAGMNDLIRPSFYDAYHEIVPVKAREGKKELVDVVGPVCETGDIFAKDRELPRFESGDLVALRSAGAYGAAMASTYNARPLIAEVMVKGANWAVTRPRQTYQEMMASQKLASWLEG